MLLKTRVILEIAKNNFADRVTDSAGELFESGQSKVSVLPVQPASPRAAATYFAGFA
jgi:hypothetical protein